MNDRSIKKLETITTTSKIGFKIMSLPLAGVKVLDLTRALAGPFSTMILLQVEEKEYEFQELHICFYKLRIGTHV